MSGMDRDKYFNKPETIEMAIGQTNLEQPCRKTTSGEEAVRMADDVLAYAQSLSERLSHKLQPVMIQSLPRPDEQKTNKRELPLLFADLRDRMEATISALRDIEHLIDRVDV